MLKVNWIFTSTKKTCFDQPVGSLPSPTQDAGSDNHHQDDETILGSRIRNSKVVSTHLWNTPRATFTNGLCFGIPFIVGVAGGLPNGCAISGCVVTFSEKSQAKPDSFATEGSAASCGKGRSNSTIAFQTNETLGP